MNKPFTLITCLITILFINCVAAQDDLKIAEAKDTKRDTKTFNVVSLDGKIEKVKIIPDYVNRMLRMTCLQDTIGISDFWDVPPEIHLLNRSFIEIRYEVRGGSNLGLGNTLILCVNGCKLYEAMHVLRYMNWDSGNQKENYHIALILNREDRRNYNLIVDIHDNVYSKLEPETNYNYNNQTVLSFDTRRNVFYSVKETVSYHVVKTKTGKIVKQKIADNFPVIILGKQTYYFIKGKWYQSGSSDEMDEI